MGRPEHPKCWAGGEVQDEIEDILLAMMEGREHTRWLIGESKNSSPSRRFKRTLMPPYHCRADCVAVVVVFIPLPDDIRKPIPGEVKQVLKVTPPRLLRQL